MNLVIVQTEEVILRRANSVRVAYGLLTLDSRQPGLSLKLAPAEENSRTVSSAASERIIPQSSRPPVT